MNYRGSAGTGKVARAALVLLGAWMVLTPCTSAPQEPVGSPQNQTGSAAADDMLQQVIANQKRMEAALNEYERVQKIEIRKTGSDANPFEIKTWRLFPSGPVMNKLSLSPAGEPLSAQSYRLELEKVAKYLAWLNQPGSAQREAYAKAERKRKERADLIASTRQAFLFTRSGTELRGERQLVRYTMVPNPAFKPTTRNASIFSKVRGVVWIDEQSGELARIEGTVTEDISIAMFLARVYKGSYFMQERYELAPGLWFPTFEQFDFDGRKYLLPFAIHERTFYSGYKRVGVPAEAIAVVRADLDKLQNK